MTQIVIGLFGLGSVGRGVVEILRKHPKYQPKFVCLVRDRTKPRFSAEDLELGDIKLVQSAEEILNDDSVDVFVELMGGANGLAWEVVKRGLERRPVVTANKALIAEHMEELEDLVAEWDTYFRCEASVAACLPILSSLNRFHNVIEDPIHKLYGVINGSTAYLINRMERTGREMPDIIEEMKSMGYLEADPRIDLEGIDAMHKLLILCRLAFRVRMTSEQCFRMGLPNMSQEDFDVFRRFRYKMLLLAYASSLSAHGSSSGDGVTGKDVSAWVMPALVHVNSPLSCLRDTTNSITVCSSYAGSVSMVGPGAGSLPTGHAVAAEILDVLGRKGVEGPWIMNDNIFPPLDTAANPVLQPDILLGTFVVRIPKDCQSCTAHFAALGGKDDYLEFAVEDEFVYILVTSSLKQILSVPGWNNKFAVWYTFTDI